VVWPLRKTSPGSGQGYRYPVVSRERERQFDLAATLDIETAGGDPL
jgi:hypothetical protein